MFNETYMTYLMQTRLAEIERRDRETAAYDHPLVEHVSRVSVLIARFRHAWTPAKPVARSERETMEAPVICLNC